MRAGQGNQTAKESASGASEMDVTLTDVISIATHPLVLTLFGAAIGWVGKLLYDRYILTLGYRQRIAEATVEKVLGYTEKHYFPLSARGIQLASALGAAIATKHAQVRKDYVKVALYRLAQYLAVDARTTRETGGVLLMKEIALETALVRLKVEIIKTLPFRLSDREYLAELGELKFTDFEKKLADKRLRSIHRELNNWISNASEVRNLCRYIMCQNDVLTYALDKIYRPWYGTKPRAMSEESQDCLKTLKAS